MAKFTRLLLNADEKEIHSRRKQSAEKANSPVASVEHSPETLLQSPGSMLQTTRQDAILRMQQTHGNDYVRRMLQNRAAQRSQAQGGEGLQEELPAMPVGAELQRQPDGDGGTGSATTTSSDAPTSTSSSATLSVTTKQAPTDQGCGGYSAKRQWSISGGSDSTNGFVVQKVAFDTRQLKCDDSDDTLPGTATYWEAWQVRGGKVFVGTSTTPHSADTFAYPSRGSHRGRNIERGNAKYIDGYTAPTSWGHDAPEAQALPSTTTQPAGWTDSGTIACSISETFDCCGDKNDKKLETSGF